jgi:hypothetical protein
MIDTLCADLPRTLADNDYQIKFVPKQPNKAERVDIWEAASVNTVEISSHRWVYQGSNSYLKYQNVEGV